MSGGPRPAPRATYRLQLNKEFGFADAGGLAPYLARLGISHAYLSPILKARAGSMHGYDIVDHAEINPELGGIAGFRRMAGAFRAAGIGIVLDIVPNHMGIGGSDNPYWLDVLESGEASRFARWFDIDWAPAEPSLGGKVLAPFLDRPLGEALGSDVLELRHDAADGSYALWVHGHHKLPLARETYAEAAAVLAGGGSLAGLLDRQHWRLADARTADDEINYRRFFIISDLAGIRVEDEAVFEPVHRLVFALVAEGLVDGLRVDHIDGLHDPAAYCRKLRARAPRPVFIVVEKILGEDEKLPGRWDVEGTTGYEFAALAAPLLADPAGEAALTAFHRRFTGVTATPAEIERDCKLRVMDHELAAELSALARRFERLARMERPRGDLTRYALRRALRAFVSALPVYRTYLDADGASAADRAVIDRAIAVARGREPELQPRAFDLVADVARGAVGSPAARDLAMRLQQFTGPVMAKGLEDTALYRYSRLLALNDVGERPDLFHRPVAAFHAANIERARHFPHGLLATSTHDSKRGEDTRCRLLALTGHAEAWAALVPEWLEQLARDGAPAIDPDDAYTCFQLLVGAWPASGAAEGLADRLVGAMRKSLREARLRSSWIAPDTAYEARVEAFVRAALRAEGAMFASFRAFAERIGRDGAMAGLVQTGLKLTVPGVPDIYQGAELWEQSLVDPDNRRPVDFAQRERLLAASAREPLAGLAAHWQDGAVKQALIARLLTVRAGHPRLFADGSYEPVEADETVAAFVRREGADALFVAVRLFPWRTEVPPAPTPPAGEWRDLLREGWPAAGSAELGGLPIVVFGSFG